MSAVDRRRIGLLCLCALAVVTSLAVVDARQQNGGAQQKWPPQFPREGATKLFEDDHDDRVGTGRPAEDAVRAQAHS